MPRAKSKPAPVREPFAVRLTLNPCTAHPAGPYVCHCRMPTDEAVRALAQAMLEEMLAQFGKVPAAVTFMREAVERERAATVAPTTTTPDDDPVETEGVPTMSKEAHDGMVQAALARRAQRESISVLRRPNVTED